MHEYSSFKPYRKWIMLALVVIGLVYVGYDIVWGG